MKFLLEKMNKSSRNLPGTPRIWVPKKIGHPVNAYQFSAAFAAEYNSGNIGVS